MPVPVPRVLQVTTASTHRINMHIVHTVHGSVATAIDYCCCTRRNLGNLQRTANLDQLRPEASYELRSTGTE